MKVDVDPIPMPLWVILDKVEVTLGQPATREEPAVGPEISCDFTVQDVDGHDIPLPSSVKDWLCEVIGDSLQDSVIAAAKAQTGNPDLLERRLQPAL